MKKNHTLKYFLLACILTLTPFVYSMDGKEKEDPLPRWGSGRTGGTSGMPGATPNIFFMGGGPGQTAGDQEAAGMEFLQKMSEEELIKFFSKLKIAQKRADQAAAADTAEDYKFKREQALAQAQHETELANLITTNLGQDTENALLRTRIMNMRLRQEKLAAQEAPAEQQARHAQTRETAIAEAIFLQDVANAARPSFFNRLQNSAVDGAIIGISSGLTTGIVSVAQDMVKEAYQFAKQRAKQHWGNGQLEAKEEQDAKEKVKEMTQITMERQKQELQALRHKNETALTNLLTAHQSLVVNAANLTAVLKDDPQATEIRNSLIVDHTATVALLVQAERKKVEKNLAATAG
jgi:hypothetical protein